MMTRYSSFAMLCITFLALLLLKSTIVEAFSTNNKNFGRTTLTRGMTNDKSALPPRRRLHDRERNEWISRSVDYYSKVMREERRRRIGQVPNNDEPEYQEQFALMAKKHYFALRKIKSGNLHHAEFIYRKIIDELSQEEDGHCDHAKLAVTTLLLALLLQRMGDRKATRSVFLNFFRIAVLDNNDTECACSAKVLQAYALFEMKQGNRQKSLELVTKAIEFDQSLAPVLQWKQFRDALERRSLEVRPGVTKQ